MNFISKISNKSDFFLLLQCKFKCPSLFYFICDIVYITVSGKQAVVVLPDLPCIIWAFSGQVNCNKSPMATEISHKSAMATKTS